MSIEMTVNEPGERCEMYIYVSYHFTSRSILCRYSRLFPFYSHFEGGDVAALRNVRTNESPCALGNGLSRRGAFFALDHGILLLLPPCRVLL